MHPATSLRCFYCDLKNIRHAFLINTVIVLKPCNSILASPPTWKCSALVFVIWAHCHVCKGELNINHTQCQFRSCDAAVNSKEISNVYTSYSKLEMKFFIISVLFLKSRHRIFLALHRRLLDTFQVSGCAGRSCKYSWRWYRTAFESRAGSAPAIQLLC